jgi:hypothetical protein
MHTQKEAGKATKTILYLMFGEHSLSAAFTPGCHSAS